MEAEVMDGERDRSVTGHEGGAGRAGRVGAECENGMCATDEERPGQLRSPGYSRGCREPTVVLGALAAFEAAFFFATMMVG